MFLWKCTLTRSDFRDICRLGSLGKNFVITVKFKREVLRDVSLFQPHINKKLSTIKITPCGTNLHFKMTSYLRLSSLFMKKTFAIYYCRFQFLMKIKTDRKDLFSWAKVPPSSIQRLANIKVPCLRYDVINYKFLGQPYTVYNKQICVNGRFFKDFAVVALNGVAKNFSKLTTMKDKTLAEIIDGQTDLEKLKADYQLELEKEKSKEYEKDDGDNEDENDGVNSRSETHGTNNSIFTLSKRSSVYKEEKTDQDIIEATEIEIMPYIIKGHKTEAAFESDAPWVYMNKKRGLTIPALGILLLRNSTEDGECNEIKMARKSAFEVVMK